MICLQIFSLDNDFRENVNGTLTLIPCVFSLIKHKDVGQKEMDPLSVFDAFQKYLKLYLKAFFTENKIVICYTN